MSTDTTVPKRERMQLAKAELLVSLACVAHRWRGELLHETPSEVAPPEAWGDADPLVRLARTYGLSFHDLAQLCDRLGAELEGRALRAGYDQHWDEIPA